MSTGEPRGPTRRAVIAWAGASAAAAAFAPGLAGADIRPMPRPPITEADPVFAADLFVEDVFAVDVAEDAP